MPPDRKHTFLPAVAALVAMLALTGPSFAQSTEPDAESPQQDAEPTSPPAAEDNAPPTQPPLGGPKPFLPKARPDGARTLDRAPQTAAEKSAKLSDLYAQLATAESAEKAKTFTDQIERLWRISGSDTINLLIGRATKAVKGKQEELAEKLFDSAVALAPDYPEIFNQRAYFHFTQNNYRAAVGDLRRVLALDPNHYKALEGLAQIWKETDNKKGAYEVMKRLLEVHPFANGAKKSFEELEREVLGQDT